MSHLIWCYQQFKEVCPPHKHKDLDALVRKYRGDENKIQSQIQEWWEQPQTREEEWEDVSKKTTSRAHIRSSGGGGSGSSGVGGGFRSERGNSGRGGGGHGRSGGGGRGGFNRAMSGGRGGGSDRRSNRDYGEKGGSRNSDKEHHREQKRESSASAQAPVQESSDHVPAVPGPHVPGPAPVKISPPLQGAWGQRAPPPAVPDQVSPTDPAVSELVSEPVELLATPDLEVVEAEDFDEPVGRVTEQDPTPAGFMENPIEEETIHTIPSGTSTVSTGNVWATKGSAHLIQAEKPKLPPSVPPVSHQTKTKGHRDGDSSRQSPKKESLDEENFPTETSLITETVLEEHSSIDVLLVPPAASEALENGLPASVNGANINAAAWQTLSDAPAPPVDTEVVQTSPPVGPVSIEPTHSVIDVPLVLNDVSAPVEESIGQIEEPVPTPIAPVVVESSKSSTVLNMGHWETSDGEEAQNIDFGFGSFGAENDVASVDETTISSSTNNVTTQANTTVQIQPLSTENVQSSNTSTVSPARPPPGLGIGMPQLPANVVHVHELENKLESASLAAKKEEAAEKPVESNLPDKKPVTSNLNTSTQTAVHATTMQPNETVMPNFPQGGMSPTYPGYGMAGMYNYNAQNGAIPNGFMGVPTPPSAGPTGPVLSNGVLTQQQKQQTITGQQSVQPGVSQGLPQQQGSLYGASTPVNPENNGSNESNATTAGTGAGTGAGAGGTAGMPPGMHGAMPYNPALYYPQQYQIGQTHGVGYGYANYAQFSGVQGGYQYQQQLMGQNGGYGQPYDEQQGQQQGQHHSNHNNHHSGNNHQGSYNKNSGGGYRGRNNHHNNHNSHNNHNTHHNNQFQGQYNPQGYAGHAGHAGHAGQPYSMGYGEHFNQRGGYATQGNVDPYMQQNSAYQSGFSNQDEDQQLSKGKGKGNNRNNFTNNQSMHQYQQGGPQQGGQSQQQQFGLQGASESSHTTGGSNGGLTYQNWGNGGL